MDNWISCQLDWQPERELRDKPLHRAIASRIEEDIRAGKLREGDRLPAQRELAGGQPVNRYQGASVVRKPGISGCHGGKRDLCRPLGTG